MTKTQALAFLTAQFAAVPAATAYFERAVEDSKVIDASGRGPLAVGYVETVNENWAAALVAEHLWAASAIASVDQVESFTSEGTTFKLRDGRTDWKAIANWFRTRSGANTGGIGVIDMVDVSDQHSIPRSQMGPPWNS